MTRLKELTSLLLDTSQPAYSLQPEVIELKGILTEAQTPKRGVPLNIAEGEMQTENGLALSPTMASLCVDDYVRTIRFFRGTHAAISDVRVRCPERPVRILYAGCGPYAALAVPLMAIHHANEAMFTLLDVYNESAENASAVIDRLGLGASVAGFETGDAASYKISPDWQPDIILLEIMQACLETEPQVAITRRLVEQAPTAILIPAEVSIDLAMVDLSGTFSPDNPNSAARDRVAVSRVFSVTRDTVRSWRGEGSTRLPAATVRIPGNLNQSYRGVYRDCVIEEYESGLTFPSHRGLDEKAGPGDTVRFHYELGKRPHLSGVVEEPVTGRRLV